MKSPAKARVRLNLGIALEGKDPELAIKEFAEAGSAYPEAFLRMGEVLRKMGRDVDAEGAYRNALSGYIAYLENQPSVVEARENLSVVYKRLGMKEDAISQLILARGYAPMSPKIRYDLGTIYAEEGRFNDAVVELREAIRLNPMDEKAHYNLGLIYLYMGDREGARQEWAEALKIAPENDRIKKSLSGL